MAVVVAEAAILVAEAAGAMLGAMLAEAAADQPI
jgi:hypothetical protein